MLKFIGKKHSLEGKLLIISSPSVGHVPTLALDQIIPHNQFTRIAFLHSSHLEPSVGYLPEHIENGALGLPAELYLQGDLLILQLRSYLRFGRKRDFAKQIAGLVANNKIKGVVVLSSLPLSTRPDRDIQSSDRSLYFKLKGQVGGQIAVAKCAQLGLIRPVQTLKDQQEEQGAVLDYAGLAAPLLKELENVLVLLVFGQNVEDKEAASYLAQQLHKVINRKQLTPLR